MNKILALSGAAFLALTSAALAQGEAAANPVQPLPAPAASLPADAAPAAAAAPVVDEDNMANELNRRQQLKQDFTLTRTVDGKVIETDKRSITYSRSDPVRSTEASKSAADALADKFDAEVLSNSEAAEEARLDFVVADLNRDDKLTTEEYLRLVDSWRETGDDADESARERQYRAFVDEIDGSGETAAETAPSDSRARIAEKFSLLTKATGAFSRADYTRAWLEEFASVDADKDMMLRGEELMKFRALNRGEGM